MIAGLVAVFFYQVAYRVESGDYPIARYDKCAYQMGFQAGLNAVADIGDTCNDGRTPVATDTECKQGYIDGYNTMVVVHFPSSCVPSFRLYLKTS
jgi:hypothetical protein